ncbi:TonB-dependent receptor [Halocola ammonii]
MTSRFLSTFTTFLFLCLAFLASGQERFTLSGYVKDEASGESIIGVNIIAEGPQVGTATNEYGFYSLSLPRGEYAIRVSFIGYQNVRDTINLVDDITRNFELKLSSIETEAAEVVADRNKNVDDAQMGTVNLEVDKIKTLPALLGEVDILKTIQYLPGVQSGGEGNTGFYVRGGGPDQNLILIDGAVVYNASHLLGFFSVFNADAIKDIELIKGGMPAEYGGRLASVLNITQKDGNAREHQFDGGIGLISSRFTAQGPIKEDTASYLISARRTYIDVLARPFINPESEFAGSSYYFYDLNAKFNYKFSDKDQLFLSGYLGRDIFNFASNRSGFSVDIPWGNTIGSLRWNHLFSDKLFLNTTLSVSNYNFGLEGGQEQLSFELFSGVRDYTAQTQINFLPNPRHTIKAGIDYTYHKFTPYNVTASSEDVTFNTGSDQEIFAHEAAVYVQDEFAITDKLLVNAGLRYSWFGLVGPFTRFINDEAGDNFGAPTPPEAIVYETGEIVEDYGGLEPRITARWKVHKNASIKASFTQNFQYIHLASLSPTGLPTDLWVPSTDKLLPQKGRQYALGYFRNFKEDRYEASVEIYYKDMQNLVEYQAGTRPENTLNTNIDDPLLSGDGYSYGAEFFVKKSRGDLNGWIGYTWSKTNRTFELIDNGAEFPARFDRRHDLSVVVNYQLNPMWTFGTTFVYATGNAITLPVERYIVEGQIVNEYGKRNGYRMPPYHRLDLSATWYPSNRPNAKERSIGSRPFESSWTFSVFNVYNRQNPYFIYFGNEGDLSAGTLDITAYQVSLFPILPSVTWNFSF